MIRLDHLLHPIRGARYACTLLAEHRSIRRAASFGESHFGGDIRYRPQNVTDGYASRLDASGDDRVLLERICAAYIKASEGYSDAGAGYGATQWWQKIRRHSLAAVRRALATRDLNALQAMYRNFFRDACGTGLAVRPHGRAASYFGSEIDDLHCRAVLADALYRIDYWRAQTGGSFPVSELHGPVVGNPFGVVLDGGLVVAGSEYQHSCAQRLANLLDEDTHKQRRAAVAEIGGGFGGMAYYLLRGGSAITYLNFDLPESLALAAYYLAKAVPHCRMLLYGEEAITESSMRRYDVILSPPWELQRLSVDSVDITFSSHALSDLTAAAQAEYLRGIVPATRGWLLDVGREDGCNALRSPLEAHHPRVASVSRQQSEWNRVRAPDAKEVEDLYCMRG
jgi:hypothetical protein